MDETEKLKAELEAWKKCARRLRQGLEFIKSYGDDHPERGYVCAKQAEDTLNDRDVIKENRP
jgi:hypothetical protein